MEIASRVPDRKRIWFGIASVILMLVFVLGIRGMLISDGAYVPDNTVSEMDNARSQVFLGGKKYALNEQTRTEHEKSQEERREILAEQRASGQQNAAQRRLAETRETEQPQGTEPNVNSESEGGRPSGEKRSGKSDKKSDKKPENKPETKPEQKPPQKPAVTPDPKLTRPAKPSKPESVDPDDDDEEDYYKKKKKDRDVLPTIKTSLRDGISTKGETISFWVTATDYKNQDIPVFSNGEGQFTVYLNGTKLTSTGASGKKTYFRPLVQNGKNIVKITAVDRKGNKRTITRRVNCAVEEEAKPIGTVYVNISAPSLGLESIAAGIPVDLYEEEPVADILRAAFSKEGISATMSDSYLRGLSREGIAAGAEISEEILERAEEYRITIYDREDWPAGWENQLFEKDFTSRSGWVYYVNGAMPKVGIGSYIPNDGDEIDLVFILFEDE